MANAVAGAALLAVQAAAQPKVKFVQPGIWSKTSGWISDPCPNINAGKTTTQLFYDHYNSGSYWPGSGPRDW